MYPHGVNIVNRGGVPQTRPGYKIALTLPPGNLQGFQIMTVNKQDQNGNLYQNGAQFIIFAVSGLVYTIPFPLVQPDKITDWTQYQLPNIQFQAEAVRVYFCVAQKSLSTVGQNIELNQTYNVLMMQDGITAAAYWDGDQNLHLNEDAPDNATPTGTWMAFSGNRLWLARGNALIAGDLLDPLSFTERISGSTQGDFLLPDNITGMINTVGYTFQTNLIVFTQDQTFSFLSYIANRETWSSTANFQTILYPALGCVAGLSIVNHAGLLWWYAKGGLVSFNSATTAYLTSRVKYMDNEMVAWTSEMYEDMSGIAACSFGSYLLMSIPSGDVFNNKTMVLDYSIADELNSVSPPAWQGVWTGTRPVNWIASLIETSGSVQCFQASVDYEPLNGSHNHIWIAFQDERVDAYDYLNASNTTLTARNQIYCSFESKLLGDGLDLKVFRFLYINLREISGKVNFKVSYRGTRGEYKPLFNKVIVAITEAWQTNNPNVLQQINSGTILVPQGRRLVSPVAQSLNQEEDQSVESIYDETIDRCFSVYAQWCGQSAVESLMLVLEPNPENPTGENQEDEDTINILNEDGISEAYNEGALSSVTTVAPASTAPNFSNNLYNRPFAPRFRDVYYSSIPPVKPQPANGITCLPCARDNYPPVTFDPTSNDEGPGYGPVQYVGNSPQSYTATCPAGSFGAPFTFNVLSDTFFALTQEAADKIAYNYAITKANEGITCYTILPPVVTSGSLSTAPSNPISYQIVATNISAPYGTISYGATNLPAGLSINTSTGVISGTITSTALTSYAVGISAQNIAGTGYGTLTINVVEPKVQISFQKPSSELTDLLLGSLEISCDGGAWRTVGIGTYPSSTGTIYGALNSIQYRIVYADGIYTTTQFQSQYDININLPQGAVTLKSGSQISCTGSILSYNTSTGNGAAVDLFDTIITGSGSGTTTGVNDYRAGGTAYGTGGGYNNSTQGAPGAILQSVIYNQQVSLSGLTLAASSLNSGAVLQLSMAQSGAQIQLGYGSLGSPEQDCIHTTSLYF